MNLAAARDAALQLTPSDAKGTVVFTRSDGATSTATVTGNSTGERFRGSRTEHTSGWTLTVWPTGNDYVFAPAIGMIALWGEKKYRVIDVDPSGPDGGAPILYRVTISK